MRLLWEAGKEAQDNRADIKSLAEDQRRMFQLVQHLANENELLRQALQHERELRERDIRELELKLRLQIAEDLRRLPPAGDK